MLQPLQPRQSKVGSPTLENICEGCHVAEKSQGPRRFIFEEDDFDVDQIVGVKNIKIQDLDELASLAMTSYDPDFASQVKQGDIIVGQKQFWLRPPALSTNEGIAPSGH